MPRASHDVADRGLLVFEPTAAGAGVYRVTPNRGLVAFDDLTAGVAVLGIAERIQRPGLGTSLARGGSASDPNAPRPSSTRQRDQPGQFRALRGHAAPDGRAAR